MNKSLFIKFITIVAFLSSQIAYAEKSGRPAKDMTELLLAIPNWKVALTLMSFKLSQSDVIEAKKSLDRAHISMTNSLPIIVKNNNVYLLGERMTYTTNGIFYKGLEFKYDAKKSYKENLDLIYAKMVGKSSYTIMNLLLGKKAFAGQTAAAGAFVAGCVVAAVASVVMLLGIAALSAGGAAVAIVAAVVAPSSFLFALGSEVKFDPMGLNSFKCTTGGWSLKTNDGTIIAATRDASGALKWTKQLPKKQPMSLNVEIPSSVLNKAIEGCSKNDKVHNEEFEDEVMQSFSKKGSLPAQLERASNTGAK